MALPKRRRRKGAAQENAATGAPAAGRQPEPPARRPDPPMPSLTPPKGTTELWIHGTHAVLAALDNPKRRILRFYITEDARENLSPRLDALHRAPPPPRIVSRQTLSDLLPNAVHQGIAVLTTPLPPLDIDGFCAALDDQDRAVVVALDQVTDPHNVGAVVRSAAAFGAAAVVMPSRYTPDETGVLAKTACGALEKVGFARVTNLARAIDTFKEHGFWCVGLDGHAETELRNLAVPEKVLFVLGSEERGLRRLTRERCDYLVRLRLTDKVDSLNVSNAAAIALYDINTRGGRG